MTPIPATPLVSIVIPVYNGADYLVQAIDSALGQTWRATEVLVVNDGSSDDGATERIVQSYGSRIRYFAKANGGVASALNRGIQEMKGDYFAWLSHDDLLPPDRLEKQLLALRTQGDGDTIVFGDYQNFTDPDHLVEDHVLANRLEVARLAIPLYAVFHRAVHGCTVLIPRTQLDRAGRFNEALKTTQDYEYWFRLMRGQPLLFVPAICARSRIHSGQGSRAMYGLHQRECAVLWRDLLSRLTDAEICAMGGSRYGFFHDLHEEFLHQTDYAVTTRQLCLMAAREAAAEARTDTARTFPDGEQPDLRDASGAYPQAATLRFGGSAFGGAQVQLSPPDDSGLCQVSGAVCGRLPAADRAVLALWCGCTAAALDLNCEADLHLAQELAEMAIPVCVHPTEALLAPMDAGARCVCYRRCAAVGPVWFSHPERTAESRLCCGQGMTVSPAQENALVERFLQGRFHPESAPTADAFALALAQACEEQAAQLRELREREALLKASLAEQKAEAMRLRAEQEALRVSTSWRITAPLRALAERRHKG